MVGQDGMSEVNLSGFTVDLDLLGKLDPVRNAGHQAGYHDTCLRGTRGSVFDCIMLWAKNPQERHAEDLGSGQGIRSGALFTPRGSCDQPLNASCQ